MIPKIAKFLLRTKATKSLMTKLGYESYLRRLSKNAFSDQQMLLSGIKVQTIFDIGANVGQTAAEYSRLFPKSTIYCFEPFPESFEELRTRFRGNSLVKPIQSAISNKVVHTGKFYVNQLSNTNSLLQTVDDVAHWIPLNIVAGFQNVATIEVPVTTIDDFCSQESINEIQILKMDIQGGELMALKGSTEKLNQGAISLVYTEIEFVPLYKNQALFYEICDFLAGYGYTLFDIYDVHSTRNGQLVWGNAIFLSAHVLARMIKKTNESQ
jgi:FkbM family methyltransferase